MLIIGGDFDYKATQMWEKCKKVMKAKLSARHAVFIDAFFFYITKWTVCFHLESHVAPTAPATKTIIISITPPFFLSSTPHHSPFDILLFCLVMLSLVCTFWVIKRSIKTLKISHDNDVAHYTNETTLIYNALHHIWAYTTRFCFIFFPFLQLYSTDTPF